MIGHLPPKPGHAESRSTFIEANCSDTVRRNENIIRFLPRVSIMGEVRTPEIFVIIWRRVEGSKDA